MNKSKAIKNMLYRYPSLVVEIDNLKIDIEQIEEVVGIAGTSGNVPAGSPTYQFNSCVENEVIDREENLNKRVEQIQRIIRSKERVKKKIENTLRLLNKDELEFVKLMFWDGVSVKLMMRMYKVEQSTIYSRKDKIINKLVGSL